MLYALADISPQCDPALAWIAPNASIMGDVRIERDVSIWWNAVLRGDNEPIVVGEGSNVQDGCILHTDPGTPLIIGHNVTVGHMVMLHGCVIGDNSLIGIGAVVLNGARIGRNCLIGANALITENKEIPDNSMVLGSPGKVVKETSAEMIEVITRTAHDYTANGKRFAAQLRVLS